MIRRATTSRSPAGRARIGILYDPEAFGRFAEAIARTLGTGRFLVIQTVFVILWVGLNVGGMAAPAGTRTPSSLLNLAFSTQAAYAAPLILLAQNRQDDRDRAQAEVDREVNARTQADTEYLARELASVRLDPRRRGDRGGPPRGGRPAWPRRSRTSTLGSTRLGPTAPDDHHPIHEPGG